MGGGTTTRLSSSRCLCRSPPIKCWLCPQIRWTPTTNCSGNLKRSSTSRSSCFSTYYERMSLNVLSFVDVHDCVCLCSKDARFFRSGGVVPMLVYYCSTCCEVAWPGQCQAPALHCGTCTTGTRVPIATACELRNTKHPPEGLGILGRWT